MKLEPAWSATPLARDYATLTKQMLRCQPRERAFDARPYGADTLTRARAQWLFRMETEYRSTSTFVGLANQMLAARADVDLIGVTLRMAQDELRHAELCAEVVRAMGGEAVREVGAPTTTLALHPGCSVEERVLRNVIFGCCVSETVNCARFVDALETISDPFVHDVTRQLLSDEALHAQFGFHYLDSWRPYLEAHPEVRASIGAYLRFAFAFLEDEYKIARDETNDETRAIGLPDVERTWHVMHATVTNAIIPGLERFGIEANDAWTRRSRR